MSEGTTYDARVYRTEVYKGSEVTTYKVRWKVGGRLWKEGFRTAAQADSFRSALLTAARRGEAFSLATGRRFCRSQGLTCGFKEWGGWDSNPGPADYESAALTG
jgi:hypothetical protein